MGEVARIARNGLTACLSLGRIQPPELHQPRPAQNGIQRLAQLMTERLEELVLQSAVALCLDARGALAFEHGPQLIDRLFHGNPAPRRLIISRLTLPLIRSYSAASM